MPNFDLMMLAPESFKCMWYFQGDTFSPLLFCLTLTPLSMLLDLFQATTTRKVNHLLLWMI